MAQVLTIMMILALGAPAPANLEKVLSPSRPLDRAILGYLELAEGGQATAEDLTELGVLLLERGFPVEAERHLRAAIKLDKHSFAARYRLGLALHRQGRILDAARAYHRALQENGTDPYARFMLAVAEEQLGRTSTAVDDYVAAFRVMPELAEPARNPLVLDSHLQVQAQLDLHRVTVTTTTFAATPVDPAAVRRMMETRPAPPPPSPSPTPTPTPQPEPVPTPEPMQLFGGAAAAAPPTPAPAPTPPPL